MTEAEPNLDRDRRERERKTGATMIVAALALVLGIALVFSSSDPAQRSALKTDKIVSTTTGQGPSINAGYVPRAVPVAPDPNG